MPIKLEFDSKPETTPADTLVRAHARTDGQVENIMPLVAHRCSMHGGKKYTMLIKYQCTCR